LEQKPEHRVQVLCYWNPLNEGWLEQGDIGRSNPRVIGTLNEVVRKDAYSV